MASQIGNANGRLAWLPSVVVMLCVGAALALTLAVWPAWNHVISRPAMITILTALVLIAVGVLLFWSMDLRHEPIAVRLVILVPIVLSVVLVVALMLDTHVRGAGFAGPG